MVEAPSASPSPAKSQSTVTYSPGHAPISERAVSPTPSNISTVSAFEAMLFRGEQREHDEGASAEPSIDDCRDVATEVDHEEERAWASLNKRLLRAAFPPIEMMSTNGNRITDRDIVISFGKVGARQLRDTVNLMLDTTQRTKQVMSQLVENDERVRGRRAASDDALESSKEQIRELKQKNQELVERLRLAETTKTRDHGRDSNALKAAKQNVQRLEGRVQQLTTKCNSYEQQADALRDKMRDSLRRDEQRLEKHKKMFFQITKRHPRFGPDNKTLEVIDMYDSEIQRLKKHIAVLTEENRALEGTRDKGYNTNLRGGLAGLSLDHVGKHTVKSSEGAAFDSRREELEDEVDRLRDVVSNLELELRSRPSLGEFRATKRRLVNSEAKLKETQSRHVRWAEEAEFKNQQTRDLIRKDKDTYRLGLYKLDSLPPDVARLHLKVLCRKLSVGNPEHLEGAIDKLICEINLIPPLEALIGHIAAIVDEHSTATGELTSSDKVPVANSARLILELKRWSQLLNELKDYKRLEGRLVRMLKQRPDARDVGGPDRDRLLWSPSDIERCVEDMVRTEGRLHNALNSSATTKGGDRSTADTGEQIRQFQLLLKHIRDLFAIREQSGLNGVYCKMNELCLYVEETTNAMSSLKSLFKLPKKTSNVALVDEIYNLFGSYNAHAQDGELSNIVDATM